jgi:hypothetical protein
MTVPPGFSPKASAIAGATRSFPAGVWLSDSSNVRHRAMRGHREGGMLVVDVPDDVAHRFLVADFPGRWREFCIPAEVVNRLPRRLLASR